MFIETLTKKIVIVEENIQSERKGRNDTFLRAI